MYLQFFTPEAAVLWTALPVELREDIGCRSWCRKCERPVPLGDVEGLVRKGNLVIRARCGFCFARLNVVVPPFGAPPN